MVIIRLPHVPYDRYPEHGLPDFWMSDLMLVDNVISFMSLEHAAIVKCPT